MGLDLRLAFFLPGGAPRNNLTSARNFPSGSSTICIGGCNFMNTARAHLIGGLEMPTLPSRFLHGMAKL
jgi:hypothetical protein